MFTKKQKKKLNSKNNIKQKKGVIMNTMGESTAVEVVGQAFKKNYHNAKDVFSKDAMAAIEAYQGSQKFAFNSQRCYFFECSMYARRCERIRKATA